MHIEFCTKLNFFRRCVRNYAKHWIFVIMAHGSVLHAGISRLITAGVPSSAMLDCTRGTPRTRICTSRASHAAAIRGLVS